MNNVWNLLTLKFDYEGGKCADTEIKGETLENGRKSPETPTRHCSTAKPFPNNDQHEGIHLLSISSKSRSNLSTFG